MYPNFRRMTKHAIEQEVQTMSEQTLNRAMRGEGGPKINPHQESLLQDELDQRMEDQKYATEMAIEANRRLSGYDNIDTNQAVDTLQETGLDTIEPNVDLEPTPIETDFPEDVQEYDPGRELAETDYTQYTDASTATPEPATQDSGLSEEEKEVLLLVGAILYEAALLKRTEDTIQAQINHSDEFIITDATLPEQITELLWTDYDRESRVPHLKSILGDNTSEAIEVIESLIKEIV